MQVPDKAGLMIDGLNSWRALQFYSLTCQLVTHKPANSSIHQLYLLSHQRRVPALSSPFMSNCCAFLRFSKSSAEVDLVVG